MDSWGDWRVKSDAKRCIEHVTRAKRPPETLTYQNVDTEDKFTKVLAWYRNMFSPPQLHKWDNLQRYLDQYNIEEAELAASTYQPENSA